MMSLTGDSNCIAEYVIKCSFYRPFTCKVPINGNYIFMMSAESGLKCILYIFGFKDIYGYNLTGVTGLSDVIEPMLFILS